MPTCSADGAGAGRGDTASLLSGCAAGAGDATGTAGDGADSTDSLLSAIYHSSYASQDEDVEEDGRKPRLARIKIPILYGAVGGGGACSSRRVQAVATTHSRDRNFPKRKSSPRGPRREGGGPPPAGLSAWEDWLVRKTVEERRQLEQRARSERHREEKQRTEEEIKSEKSRKTAERVHEWMRNKLEQLQLEEEQTERKERTKMEEREQERQRILEKAHESYQQWLQHKAAAEKEKKQRQQEEMERLSAEKRERRERAEREFREWLEKAKTRPRPKREWPLGKGKGTYSNAGYPAPSFYNPVPWKPIPTPPQDAVCPKSAKGKKARCSSAPADRRGAPTAAGRPGAARLRS
ncbi:coiled-coil domain-containing protein 34 [Lampetra fluviatilis]